VAGVGFHSHQLFSKLLVEVNLARLDDAAVVDRAVLGDGPVGVDLDVDVQGSADLDRFWLVRKLSGCIGGGCVTYVEARDDAVEGGGTISVCGPHSAQPGAVVGDECLVEEGQSCLALDTTFSRCVILTYAEVLSESAVDGDILCGDEVAERCVRVVAGERAIRAGCVAMLVICQNISWHRGTQERHTQRLIKTSSIGSQVLTSITPMSSSSGMPTCGVLVFVLFSQTPLTILAFFSQTLMSDRNAHT
jgi:hypothetical protein